VVPEEGIWWVKTEKRQTVQHLEEKEEEDRLGMPSSSSSIQHKEVILFKQVKLNSNIFPALQLTFVFCPP
jgi:hypothetical protein